MKKLAELLKNRKYKTILKVGPRLKQPIDPVAVRMLTIAKGKMLTKKITLVSSDQNFLLVAIALKKKIKTQFIFAISNLSSARHV